MSKPTDHKYHLLVDNRTEGWSFHSGHDSAQAALDEAQTSGICSPFRIVRIIEFIEIPEMYHVKNFDPQEAFNTWWPEAHGDTPERRAALRAFDFARSLP